MIKKYDVVMLGHKRIPSRDGGIEVVVEELSTRMANLGHNVTCINRNVTLNEDNSKANNKIKEYKDVKIKYAPTIDIKGISAVSSSFFASIMACSKKYNVVHFHAEGPAFMCWLPKIFKKKVIVTIHGLDHKRAKWGKFASWYIMKGEQNAVKFADEIIVLSSSDKEYFKNKYDRETTLIPNGVNKPVVKNNKIIKEKYNLEKNDYILYLGRIVPEKAIHELIDAYKNISISKKLVIAGGSSNTDSYFNELKKSNERNNNIIFTGFVNGEELEELYSNAYLYCLPSHIEGMPLSLLEAMSYGNCCLTSDLNICKDVIGNCGYTFDTGNIDDLKEKIVELCANEQLVNNCKEIASDFICNRYNWDKIVNQTLELYN